MSRIIFHLARRPKKRGIIRSLDCSCDFRKAHTDLRSPGLTPRRICEDQLQRFIAERGLGIWDHRMIEDDPVADSLRYQVLQESGGRCALCGATAKDALLQVDHILPRSRGGSNEKSNLQILCQRCNGGKNNKDQTDFRSWNVPSDSGPPDPQPSNLAEPDA